MKGFTSEWLHSKTASPVAARLRHPKPQPNVGQESLVVDQDEEGREGRIVVRITRKGARLLDADNLAGGIKPLLDSLRYEKLIPEDNPKAIRLEVRQTTAKAQERGTLVEIIYPTPWTPSHTLTHG